MPVTEDEATARSSNPGGISGLHTQVLLAVLPVLMALTGIWIAGPEIWATLDFGWILLAVTVFALGWAVLVRSRTARCVAVVFLAASIILATNVLSTGLYTHWASSDAEAVNSTWQMIATSLRRISLLLWPAVPIILMHVFPTGPIEIKLVRVLGAAALVAYAASATALGVQSTRSIDEDSWLWVASGAAVALGLVMGIVTLTLRFRSGSPVERRQIGAFGFVQLCLVAFFFSTVPMGVQLSDHAAFMAYVLWAVGVLFCVLYGMARHRLYDVRFVVRRVGLYSLLTVLLSGTFLGVYLGLSALFTRAVSSQDFTWLAVGAAVVVVLLLEPVRRRLIGRVEDRVLGDRNRPLRAFARMQMDADRSRLADSYDAITQALAAAVRAPGAALALWERSGMRTVAVHGSPGERPITLPMSYRGELLGQVTMGCRTAGEDYPPADRLLLEQLVAQAAAQIYGVRRDRELDETRREALTAIVDERSRLGRDLHDGVAPLLAGAGLTAEALRRDLAPGSPGERDAARLAERLRHAAGEVRNIAHGLDPGPLSQSLTEAVTTYLESLKGPQLPKFSVHIRVDELSPVVANAAYLVVLEGVNNIIRHAHATHARVRVRTDGKDLTITIEDDGRGIPHPYVSGLGITSMRKRVEALGGTFTIGAPPNGGTVVEARIQAAS